MKKFFMIAGLALALLPGKAFALTAGWQAWGVPGVNAQVVQQQNCAACQSRWEFGNGSWGQFKVVVALNNDMVWTWNTLEPVWRPWARVIPGTVVAIDYKKEGSEVVVRIDCTSLKTGKHVIARKRIDFGPFWKEGWGEVKVYSYSVRNNPYFARLRHHWVTTLPPYALDFSAGWIMDDNATPRVWTAKDPF